MTEEKTTPKKPGLTLDKLITGVLAKIGEIFDSILGRKAQTSSLATSGLIVRAKRLLDSQVRVLDENRKFVPHLFTLKVEWGKFSLESADSLKAVETEILAALIDHINDNRYLTHAPLQVTTKPDYFVEGIHIVSSFGDAERDDDEVDLSVTMPQIKVGNLIPPPPVAPEPEPPKPLDRIVIAKFAVNGTENEKRLRFAPGERVNVGRTRENDLPLDDSSVSKLHAALSFNAAGELVVADTGSTNGTFINKERLAYGKAFPICDGDMVGFGNIEVFFNHVLPSPEPLAEEERPTEDYTVEIHGNAPPEMPADPPGPMRIEFNPDGPNADVPEDDLNPS